MVVSENVTKPPETVIEQLLIIRNDVVWEEKLGGVPIPAAAAAAAAAAVSGQQWEDKFKKPHNKRIYNDDESYSIRHWTDVSPGEVCIVPFSLRGHFWRVMSSS